MIIDRIKQVIDYKNISVRKFCIEIGVANGFLDKVKDVGSEKVAKILYTYPDINPEWLLTGKGDMIKKPLLSIIDNNRVDELQEIIDIQRKLIKNLETEIVRLNEEINRSSNFPKTHMAAESKLKYETKKR